MLLRRFSVVDTLPAHAQSILFLRFYISVAKSINPSALGGPVISYFVCRQLLLGIRDTHDELVAATLRALADVVPILGSRVVIGPQRYKHFGNGAPKVGEHFGG